MSNRRPARSRKFTVGFAAFAALVAVVGRAASQEMHQSDLNEQLWPALRSGTAAEVEALLNQGADPNYNIRSANDKTGLGALLTGLQHGRVTLHIAAGPPILAEALGGLAFEPLTQQKLGLRKAIRKRFVPGDITWTDGIGKIRVLLAHHADPNQRYDNINPLIQAVGLRRADVAQLLLQYGADPDAKSANGDTARNCAIREKETEILALITSQSARTMHR
jgi:hypothetical protein